MITDARGFVDVFNDVVLVSMHFVHLMEMEDVDKLGSDIGSLRKVQFASNGQLDSVSDHENDEICVEALGAG